MSETTFTHKDLARMLGVSETTVKSYRRKFPGCIPVANQGKPIRFTEEGARVAARIRALFDTGMSVEDVRRRLADEFSFISPEAHPRQTVRQEPVRVAEPGPGPGPELTIGVSNMAKGMVALTQQQKTILSRVQGLESMLEELGLGQSRERLTRLGEQRQNEARQREAQLENRLDRLDESTKELSRTVHTLADQLGRLMEKRARAEEERRARDAQALSNAADMTGAGSGNAHPAPPIPSSSPTGTPPPFAAQESWTVQPAAASGEPDTRTASDAQPPDTHCPDAPCPDAPCPDAPCPDAHSPDAPCPDAHSPDAHSPNVYSSDASRPCTPAPDTSGPAIPPPDASGPDTAREPLAAPYASRSGPADANGQTGAAPEPTSARIIPLRPENGDKTGLRTIQRSGFPTARPDARVAEAPSEPPRLFFTLPLVVRTEDGRYISAGGRSRGRFSLNDLKAMLIYGYTPPDHFSLRWEQQGAEWWLFLERETSDKTLHLLLTELSSQRGGNVAEILQIRRGGETWHPVEICSIIDALAAREF